MILKKDKKYRIKYTGQFCHMKGTKESTKDAFCKGTITLEVYFIGDYGNEVTHHDRYIFYSPTFAAYLMYHSKNPEEYLKEESPYTPEQQAILDALEENIIKLKKQFDNE